MANSKNTRRQPVPEPEEELEDSIPEEKIDTTETEDYDVIGDIAADLSERETAEAVGEVGPRAQTLQGFDFSKLSIEDLQALKARLDATPSKQGKKGNNTITLRRIDDRFVMKVGRARSKMVFDDLLDKKVEKFSIPVYFLGEKEPVEMDYTEFMQSERVTCEVLGIMSNKRPEVEGTVFSQELGVEVEQVVTYVDQVFKVKMPDGKILELKADSVNL